MVKLFHAPNKDTKIFLLHRVLSVPARSTSINRTNRYAVDYQRYLKMTYITNSRRIHILKLLASYRWKSEIKHSYLVSFPSSNTRPLTNTTFPIKRINPYCHVEGIKSKNINILLLNKQLSQKLEMKKIVIHQRRKKKSSFSTQ